MAANGNSGTATSASQAQSQAAAGNAAASNAANGNTGTGNTSTSNTGGTTGGKGNAGSTNTSTSNTSGESNAKGEASKGNAEASNNKNTATDAAGLKAPSQDYSKGYDYSDQKGFSAFINFLGKVSSPNSVETARAGLPSEVVAKADRVYTDARKEGKTEEESQQEARNLLTTEVGISTPVYFQAKNTGPTYNPAVTQRANTNKTIAAGSSKMGPSAPAASVTPSAAPANTAGPASGSTGTEGASAAPSTSDATNTGITNRGGTVANGGGTAVTDSGTGGSVSSSITPPSRDASSIGLGVYNTDRANYDQDNWNRGMEAESSSLVSDEECKAFAKRAFLENSEPFKRVRLTIIKKC